MPDGHNYLLGRGENLTIPIEPLSKGGAKSHPYSFAEAKFAMLPKAVETARVLGELPLVACLEDQAVAVLTLHPAYLAKSYFPTGLLDAVGLRTVGSRAATIVPRRPSRDFEEGMPTGTTQLFVAGPRGHFLTFAHSLAGWNESTDGAEDLIKIEDFRAPSVEERIRPIQSVAATTLLEVALHGAGLPLTTVLDGFRAYLDSLGVELDLGRPLVAGPLLFLPLRVAREVVPEIARFAFLRVAREMPPLQLLGSDVRIGVPGSARRQCRLPVEGPIDPNITVAVFDGGLPPAPDLSAWVKVITVPGVGPPVSTYQEHGLAVTSALLFGSLDEGQEPGVPYAHVNHYRVLDAEAKRDPHGELYPVLERIVGVLKSQRPEYLAICLGPQQPVEDDEVSAWTALLDPLLARGDALAVIAAGNSGELDAESGLNRIQPPADCVNALAVGACERWPLPYGRAPYSSIGPGRSPGRIKPDLVAFGGTPHDPFWVLCRGFPPKAMPNSGTSFAAPTVLRAGLGIRAAPRPRAEAPDDPCVARPSQRR